MVCPHCGSAAFSRDKHLNPAPKDGIVFRAHVCNVPSCGRTFLSAQLVIVNEFEPVERLDSVLKALMDESDARSRSRDEEYPEEEVSEPYEPATPEEAFAAQELDEIIAEAERIAREDYESALATQRALDEERE